MSYTELTVWTRGIIMDKEGRDIVNSVSKAGRLEGKYTQAMENYVDNPDRTNCPTRKYCRVSDTEIENALTYENEQPNIVVLVEQTMVLDMPGGRSGLTALMDTEKPATLPGLPGGVRRHRVEEGSRIRVDVLARCSERVQHVAEDRIRSAVSHEEDGVAVEEFA